MSYLSPPTLTRSEQQALLQVCSVHPRDHLIFSLALGTGLRLSEIVGLNVGDAFTPDGTPRSRIRLRKEITYRWLHTYNEIRPHDSLGRIPPATFRKRLQKLENSAFALST